VSRLNESARGFAGSVACCEMMDWIFWCEGEDRTWRIYHIVAGRGLAWVSGYGWGYL